MLYHASKLRLYPLRSVVLSVDSGKSEGTLEMTQVVGWLTSMVFFVFSKSSKYDARSCVPLLCPAINCANSAERDMCEGCVRCRKGILSSIFVSHWLSFFQLILSPQMVLLSGSAPIFTFVVSACSDRCINVPPIIKFFEKSYSQFNPNIVLRCCP